MAAAAPGGERRAVCTAERERPRRGCLTRVFHRSARRDSMNSASIAWISAGSAITWAGPKR
jgi:hypothetical protein